MHNEREATISAKQGLYSQSGRTSHRKISWRLEVASFEFRLFDRLEIWQAPPE